MIERQKAPQRRKLSSSRIIQLINKQCELSAGSVAEMYCVLVRQQKKEEIVPSELAVMAEAYRIELSRKLLHIADWV